MTYHPYKKTAAQKIVQQLLSNIQIYQLLFQMPDVAIVLGNGAVGGEHSRFGNVHQTFAPPAQWIAGVIAERLSLAHDVCIEVRQRLEPIFANQFIVQASQIFSSASSHHFRTSEEFDGATDVGIALYPLCGVVIANRIAMDDLIGGLTKDINIFFAHLLADFHIGAVHRAQCQCAVQHELHVASTGSFLFRKLPDALSFFNGKRFVPMVVIAYSVIISIVLSLFWPVVQTGINNFGIWIANSSDTSPILAPFIYGTLERLLLPFGLHHMLTIPMNYTSFGGTYTIATGVNAGSQVFGQDPLWLAWVNDLINFKKAGDMTAYTNLLTTVTPARFKVGQMIGATGLLLGIALAMYRRVDADKRAKYKSMFISTALAVFLTGVTEPLEFMFMFCALPLYIVYALLQGCAFAMAGVIHLRLHSFGNLEFITRIPMSLQAGLLGDIINFVICIAAFFAIGYFVAYFMIGKLKLATPGRLGNYTDDNADDSAASTDSNKNSDKNSGNSQAERIIALLGGRENIVLVDACMTRLRVTVKDPSKVADLAAWKGEGALSLMVKGDGIQAVYGPKADVLKSDINDIL